MTTFHVYALQFHGAVHPFNVGPLYATRPLATAAKKQRLAEWAAFEASGQGSIFGTLEIQRLAVVGVPAIQARLQPAAVTS